MQYSAVFVAFMIRIGGVITAPAELAKGNNNASLAVSANEVAGTDKSYNKEQNYIIASWSQPGKAEKNKTGFNNLQTHADPERKAAPVTFLDPPPYWKKTAGNEPGRGVGGPWQKHGSVRNTRGVRNTGGFGNTGGVGGQGQGSNL